MLRNLKLLPSSLLFRGTKQNNSRRIQLSRNYSNETPPPNNPANGTKINIFSKELVIKPYHIGLLGLSVIGIYYFGFDQDETEKDCKCGEYSREKRWKVKMYRTIPFRMFSKLWGQFSNLELPPWARDRLLPWYVKTYGVDLSEAICEDIKSYKTLAELFGRKLKPGCRPVDPKCVLVSPADGIIQHYGKVNLETMRLEQIKGRSYSLPKFFGITPNDSKECPYPLDTENLVGCGKSLWFCVIYLSPGDYHGFHSPADWKIWKRRHISGQLLSVRPPYAKWIPGLFAVNERVVYIGEWKHGFMSMTPVGATNVGSIQIYNDTDLNTNSLKSWADMEDHVQEKKFCTPIKLSKGSPFGEFKLGSTVVLIFEAPEDFEFEVQPNQKIKWGEALC